MNGSNDPRLGRSGYNPRTQAYHVYHDWESEETVAETVLRSIAAVRNLEICELESPHERLDIDALNALFRPQGDRYPRGPGYLAFDLSECSVVVFASGEIQIYGPNQPTPPMLNR